MAKKHSDPIGDNPEHRQGNSCGYTLKPDGRIIPAPLYIQRFEKTRDERHGINDLMKLFTSHCADLLAEISRRDTSTWDDICEDYGLNKETHDIKFDGTYITLTPKPKPTENSAHDQRSTTGD